MSFNRFIVMGNLLRDPQIKTLPSGAIVAELGVATNRKFKTQAGEEREEVCFMDATAFGRTAEVIAQYFTKGKPILLEGRIKTEQWSAQDGTKRSKNVMVIDSFQFLPDGSRGGQDNEGEPTARQDRGGQGAPARQVNHRGPMEQGGERKGWGGKPQRAEPATAPFGDEQHFDEADIPF